MLFRAERALIDGALRPADILVADGVITAVLGYGEASPDAVPGAVLVPDGTLLLPGNVDCHVHVNEPGRTEWEGFASATQAAALGGITTIVDMPLNSVPPTIDPAALALKQSVARSQVRVDTGFWGGAVPESLGSLEALWEQGVFGFKCFLADSGVPEFPRLDREQFGRAMAEVAGFDGLMIVHAEDPAVLGAVPPWSSKAYADFLLSRPDEAEVSAIGLVIDQVREHGTRAHILHLSSAQALDQILAARQEGLPLTVETCPHYLVFASEQIPDAAAEFKCCPPIRDSGNQAALWQALEEGIIDIVVSDHSPSTVAEKQKGAGDLALAWGGISSLQVTFPTMVDAAAAHGHDITRVSQWMAAGPAAVAGLSTKGAIAAGRDADLITFAPDQAAPISSARLAHKNKLCAYDGRTTSGSVTGTFLRGEPVGSATAWAPRGRLLSRP